MIESYPQAILFLIFLAFGIIAGLVLSFYKVFIFITNHKKNILAKSEFDRYNTICAEGLCNENAVVMKE